MSGYRFCIGDNSGVVLDQCLGGEELGELILEEGIVFDNVVPRTSQIGVFDVF